MADFDPYSLRAGQGINLEQVQNSLRLSEAKITLFEQRKRTLLETGKRFRLLLRTTMIAMAPQQFNQDSPWQPIFGPHHPDFSRGMLDNYLEAHKAYDEAQANIYDVEIAQEKASAAILKAAIESATDPAKRLTGPGMM